MTGSQSPAVKKKNCGFTLIEIAIVLMIVGLLLGGLLPTISGQIEKQRTNETRKQLEEIQQALFGFAVIYGRLPCPATLASNGVESPAGGDCTTFQNGYVPAVTMGISGPTNAFLLLDAWGNPIRYAVTSWDRTVAPIQNRVFTTTDGMKTVGISNLSPNLLVCANSTTAGFDGSNCGAGNALTVNPGVPAIIFSTGKNGALGSSGSDESANLDNNRVYVSHPPTAGTNEFDDLMIWISPNILLNRMVTAGKLP